MSIGARISPRGSEASIREASATWQSPARCAAGAEVPDCGQKRVPGRTMASTSATAASMTAPFTAARAVRSCASQALHSPADGIAANAPATAPARVTNTATASAAPSSSA